MMPRPGAANAVVPKNGIGIAFWIAGVPGSADMVKVDVPSAIAAGIRRLGIAAARNSACAIGASTKNATKRLTPPYDHSAGEYDREHGPARSQTLGHEASNGRHGAAVLHELAEQRAKEKNWEELHDESCSAAHEGLRPMGEQRLSRQARRQDRRGRSEQKHAPAAIGEPDQ
jgi:hypothetical protein